MPYNKKGNQLREPYSKHLEDGIFEIRCKVGNNIEQIIKKGLKKNENIKKI